MQHACLKVTSKRLISRRYYKLGSSWKDSKAKHKRSMRARAFVLPALEAGNFFVCCIVYCLHNTATRFAHVTQHRHTSVTTCATPPLPLPPTLSCLPHRTTAAPGVWLQIAAVGCYWEVELRREPDNRVITATESTKPAKSCHRRFATRDTRGAFEDNDCRLGY